MEKLPPLSEEHQLLHLLDRLNQAKTTGYVSLFHALRPSYEAMHSLLDQMLCKSLNHHIQAKSAPSEDQEESKENTVSQEQSLFRSQVSQVHEYLVSLTQ